MPKNILNLTFCENILFSDESDIFPNKRGKLYIGKAKGEDLELDIENFWAYIQDELWKFNDKLKNRDYV